MADTPVESKIALTEVAISLTVDPAAAVTVELPKIPCTVKVSACIRLVSVCQLLHMHLSAKLEFIPVVSVLSETALKAPKASILIDDTDN